MNAMFHRCARALVALALLGGAAGCGDDEKSDTAPTLPSAQSMAMDVSFFMQEQQAPAVPAIRPNFMAAATRVLVIDAVFTALALPPSAALAIALSTPPSRDDDGSWWWIYTWRHGSQDYQVRLRGERNDGMVDWEMYLVWPDHDPWLWYTGSSATEGASGTWTFYDLADRTDREVARITWEYGGPANAYLRLAVTDSEAENIGDQMTFTVSGADHAISFIDVSALETWSITWNTETREGSLRVPGYNGGVIACWDGSFQDVTCP